MDLNSKGSAVSSGLHHSFSLSSLPSGSQQSQMTAHILSAGVSSTQMSPESSKVSFQPVPECSTSIAASTSRSSYHFSPPSSSSLLSHPVKSARLAPPSQSHDEDRDSLEVYSATSPSTTTSHTPQTSGRISASLVEGPTSTHGHCSKTSQALEEDSVQQVADSNSLKAIMPCKVCGDRASGYHYGVTSCEGCKGFFRRSIQKQIEYRCLRDGKCLVIRLNRNRCQYCRFKKCLAVGMSRDSVRYGRVPKRSKSQEDQSVSSSDSSVDQSALESKQLAIYDVILCISQAHHAHCAVTEDKVKTIVQHPSTLMTKIHVPAGQMYFSNQELEMQRLLMFQQLAAFITPSIHGVVEFSKRVPNFQDLTQDDQLILIKTGFFEVWLTRMSRMINKEKNVLVLEDGSCIPGEELAVVYSPEFVSSMFEVISGFNMLHLNDTEIGLFTGIVVATADRQGLSDMPAVERIQDRLVEALKLQVSRNHPTVENLFASIIMKLPELRTLGSTHNDLLRWYRLQWHRGNIPPLFAEIFDIPKNQTEVHI